MEAKEPNATRSNPIDAIVKQTEELSVSKVQIIPNEIMGFIIEHLKKDEQYKTLASIARCSQGLFELAIPLLYETITVTKYNQNRLVYGHSRDFTYDLGSSEERGQASKDFAAACTREFILETVPKDIIFDCFRGVKEVVLTGKCHSEWCVRDPDPHKPPAIYDALAEYAHKYALSDPLHVNIQISHRDPRARTLLSFGCIRLRLIVNTEMANARINKPHDHITYGFQNMPLDYNRTEAMVMAFMMRGVVQFRGSTAGPRPQFAGGLAEELGNVLYTCMRHDRGWLGKIYLCGVPELLLSAGERENAGEDVNERTLEKIYDTFSIDHRPSWEKFVAQVHLVEPTYRRSMTEVADDHRKYLKDTREFSPIFPKYFPHTGCVRGRRSAQQEHAANAASLY